MQETLLRVGKLVVRQVELPFQPAGFFNELPDPEPEPEFCSFSLLFLRDILSDREFLVDSGASVSVFPGPKSTSSEGVRLLTADGTPMVCSGTKIIPLRFSCGSGSKVYSWKFQLAPVSVPLLGADFLEHFNLLVDIKGRKVVHAQCPEDVVMYASPSPQPAFRRASFLSAPAQIQKLLSEYPDVLSSDGFTASKPRHGVRHHLLTTPGPPVFAKPRRLDPDKLSAAKAEFSAMEAAGIIRRSSSPWSSPLHMVKKKDGGWRPCGDYRRLNNVTIPDRYPLPNIADFTSRIAGSTVFSRLDLQKGYYQIPMASEDVPKTAIVTPFGMFEFLRLPFGLRNAGNTFQRMMDQILGNLPYCFVYIDDILIFSPDLQTHVQNLRDVLELCRVHGLTIGLSKCEFAVEETEFLGHHLSSSGLRPLSKHTSAITDFPPPSDKPGLQRFLGMINFYRRFLKNAAQILAPLTNALKGPGKSLLWTEDLNSAFLLAKKLLAAVPVLTHPEPGAPLSLAVDASDSHVGAVFQQQVRGSWFPLAFFSKKLSSAESKYSAFDRELLAAYSSIRHFRFLLEGRSFTLFTDHKPLTHALFRSSPPWSARQQRHLAFISEFTSDIVHVPGSENSVADALSRPFSPQPVSAPPVLSPPSLHAVDLEISAPGFDFSALPALQSACPSVQAMLSNPSLSVVSIPFLQTLFCDLSSGSPRPLVPEVLRKNLFLSLHGISHPGVRASRRLLSSRFVWPGLSRDIGLWSRACLRCQQSKVQTHVKSSVPRIPVPARRFSHVHLDLVGPLPSSQGYSYLLTMIDRTSRWPEAVPLSSITAESCARAFIASWVSRFGVPALLTTDRGAQFTSSVWSEVCSVLGVSHIQTTSFHPQSNGMIERFHRSLKGALRARLASSDWVSHLPLVMLGLRAAPKDDSGFSPAEAVYGSTLSLPGEFIEHTELPPEVFLRKIERAVSGLSGPPRHHVTPSSPQPLPRELLAAEFVFVRDDTSKPPLSPLYRGPYKVLERFDKFFILQIGDKTDSVSVDRLKAVFSPTTVTPAAPPPRGRPRLQPASVSVPPAHVKKKVRFELPVPATKLRRNPHRTVRGSQPLSAVLRPHLLGGVSVAPTDSLVCP